MANIDKSQLQKVCLYASTKFDLEDQDVLKCFSCAQSIKRLDTGEDSTERKWIIRTDDEEYVNALIKDGKINYPEDEKDISFAITPCCSNTDIPDEWVTDVLVENRQEEEIVSEDIQPEMLSSNNIQLAASPYHVSAGPLFMRAPSAGQQFCQQQFPFVRAPFPAQGQMQFSYFPFVPGNIPPVTQGSTYPNLYAVSQHHQPPPPYTIESQSQLPMSSERGSSPSNRYTFKPANKDEHFTGESVLGDGHISIETYGKTNEKIIEVSGFDTDNFDEEKFRMYFEGRKSGGGEIKELSFDSTKETAYILYEDTKDATNVLSKQHVYSGSQLHLQWYVAKERDKNHSTEKDSGTGQGNIVEVSGFDKDNFDEEKFQMYFESNKSGGGEIQSISYDSMMKFAYIAFEETEVATRVLANQHVYSGSQLHLQWHVPNEKDNPESTDTWVVQGNTIEVSGFDKDSFDAEKFQMYFEGKKSGGGEIRNISYDSTKIHAYITFEDPDVATNVLAKSHVYSGSQLHLQLYAPKDIGSRKSTDTRPSQGNVIEVSGFDKDSLDEEKFQMYFEGKKSGGGEIQSIFYDSMKEFACITFEDPDVATNVLAKEHIYSGSQLHLKLYVPKEKGNTIKVSGFDKENFDEEKFQMYFEGKKSGGGEIQNISYDRTREFAYIIFEDPEVASNVLATSHIYSGSKLHLQWHDPKDKLENLSADKNTRKGSTIEVSGFDKDNFDEEKFQMYFESKKSGGGEVQEISYDNKKETAFIAFEDPAVASNVVKQSHVYCGSTLQVQWHIPKEMYKDRVLLEYIPSDIDDELLRTFLERVSDTETKSILYSTDEGTALATFGDDIDFKILTENLKKKQIRKRNLKFSKVPVTDTVLVKGQSLTLDTEKIELYFQNTRKSGGGEVKKIEEEDGYCLIYFKDHTVVDKVCERNHELKTEKLDVHPYYECLGLSRDVIPIKIPDNVELTVEPDKLLYLTRSKTWSQKIEHEANSIASKIIWPSGTSDLLMIECKLQANDPSARVLVQRWRDSVESKIIARIEQLQVQKFSLPNDTWGEVMHQIEAKTSEHIIIKKHAREIVIVGEESDIKHLVSEIKKFISTAENNVARRKMRKEKKVPMDESKLRLLNITNFKDSTEEGKSDLKVTLNIQQECVLFEGTASDIEEGKHKLLRICNGFEEKELEDFSSNLKKFMQLKEIKQEISKNIKDNRIVAVWEVDKKNRVKVLSTTTGDAQKAENLLRNIVVETKYPYESQSAGLLSSQIWHNAVKDIKEQYQNCVDLRHNEEKNEIIILTTKKFAGDVLELVAEFFNKNTILETTLEVSKGIERFAHKHKFSALQSISNQLREEQVKIQISSEEIRISGTKKGLNRATAEVNSLVQSIKKKQHILKKPGISKYIVSQGKDKLRQIEERHKCVIEMDADDTDHSNRLQIKELCNCVLHNGTKISVMKGDITELKVDVITNAANKNLDHSGGVAGIIAQKGGKTIQYECSQHIQKIGEMRTADVFCSKPGKLPCKMIAHAVGPVWSNGRCNEPVDLYDSVLNVLKKTEDERFNSVALPAISTGIYDYPIEKATKTICEAVERFFGRSQYSRIQKVILCDVSDEAVNSFKNAMQQVFRNVKVLKSDPKPSTEWQLKKKAVKQSTVSLKKKTPERQNDIKVSVVSGQLADEKVDAIVNTTSQDLQLTNGAVSSSLLKAAGKELQDMCDANYKGGINHDDFATTTGGKLKCKFVLHTALPAYNKDGSSLSVLETVMKKCLMFADMEGCKTISFPAFGTGNLSYPKEMVAKDMFRIVSNFESIRSLKEVRFLIYEKDAEVLKAFKEEEQKHSVVTPSKRQREKGRFSNDGKGDDCDDNDDETPLDSACFTIGLTKLTVYKGDITDINIDAVVNSTDEEFSFGGHVGQLFYNNGGPNLKKEVSRKRNEMKKRGISVTTSGSTLTKYRNIIHVSVDPSMDWKAKILQILQAAEENSFHTVAIPALGTGNLGKTIISLVEPVLLSVIDFQSSADKLQDIHMVLFQPGMAEEFIKEMKQQMEQVKKSKPNIFVKYAKKVFSAFVGGAGNQEKSDEVKMDFGPAEKQVENSTILTFYADSDSTISSATKALEELCKSEYTENVFDDEIISNLSPEEMQTIKGVEYEHRVQVMVNHQDGIITVHGLPDCVIQASKVIDKVIKLAMKSKYEDDQAKLVAEMVQWKMVLISSSGTELEDYPENVNIKIETAYRQQHDYVQFEDKGGVEYEIDFSTMKEYPTNNSEDSVTVIRQDKKINNAEMVSFPKSWDEMPDSENVTLNLLDSKSNEYQEVETEFRRTLGPLDSKITLAKIQRIQNKGLFQQFMAKKMVIERNNVSGTQNERILWHGTSEDAEESINFNGFNRSFCGKNAVVYGQGVYFAVNSSYSAEPSCTYSPKDSSGNRRIYQCKVLTGEYTKGDRTMRYAPLKGSNKTLMYDSVVDDEQNPEIFVIFHDSQAYPEYLITFNS